MVKVQKGSAKETATKEAPAKEAAEAKTATAKTAKTAKADKAQDKKVARTSQKDLVDQIILKAGPDGISAEGIAQKMELITDDTEKDERSKALKKVRTLARSAIGSAAQSKDGRSAVYVHPSLV